MCLDADAPTGNYTHVNVLDMVRSRRQFFKIHWYVCETHVVHVVQRGRRAIAMFAVLLAGSAQPISAVEYVLRRALIGGPFAGTIQAYIIATDHWCRYHCTLRFELLTAATAPSQPPVHWPVL